MQKYSYTQHAWIILVNDVRAEHCLCPALDVLKYNKQFAIQSKIY